MEIVREFTQCGIHYRLIRLADGSTQLFVQDKAAYRARKRLARRGQYQTFSCAPVVWRRVDSFSSLYDEQQAA